MTIKTPDDLRGVVVEAIEASGNKAKDIRSSGQPHEHDGKLLFRENMCFCDVGVYQLRVQHIYEHPDLDDYVFFASCPIVDQEAKELSVIEDMLRNAGIKVKRRSQQITFEVTPEKDKLRSAIIAFFNAESEVYQASEDYQQKLAALRSTTPDIS